MSQKPSAWSRQHITPTPDSELTSSQREPGLGGPDPMAEHEALDHFAHFYDDQADQFATAIPFIQEGIERGERCIYIAADNTVDEVLGAMRARGVDVDAARDSGTLSVYTAEETYRRTGEFDPEAMNDFWKETLEDATEDEFAGIRAAAEMTWALDAPDLDLSNLCEYEELLNPLYDGDEYTVLCQYNRSRFPADILHEVLETHPYLISDATVCENIYYTPPSEYFSSTEPSKTFDRKLSTLVERTETRTTLQTQTRFLQRLYELASRPAPFDEKLQAIFDLGCEWFDLELGGLAKVDPETNLFEVEAVSGEHESLTPGARLDLTQTYCRVIADDGDGDAVPEPVGITEPEANGFTVEACVADFGIHTYLGTRIPVTGARDRTFFFVAEESQDRAFTDAERTFHRLMGQWVQYELERDQRERFLRECYEITAAADLSFDEKLEQLLELGCDQFGLEMGGLNHLPSWDGKFRLEKSVGFDLDPDEELWADPNDDCYCRRTVTEDEPVEMPDVRGTHWVEDSIYQSFGITSYFGTKVSSGSKTYGTLWFGSTEPRETSFSETERSFIELMGQWVSYEVERREHNEAQRTLYKITSNTDLSTDEKIDRLLEAGCERLDLSIGMLTHERTDAFEIEHMHGSHPDLDEGTLTPPLTDNYCRRVVDTGDSLSVADTEAAGWGEDALCHEFDLKCYTGTQVIVDDDPYGTVCFTDLEPREEFTTSEQAFVDLVGQCIGYEFERQRYEQELEKTIDELQESNERLEQFAYAASHDLQEPLRMVTSYLQLLEKRYGGAFDEDGEEFLEFAVDGAERMKEMIDGLLEYSRVESRGDPLEPVDLEEVLEEVLTDVQLEVEESDAEITVEELPRVEGDASQLRQVFQNLIANAITYSGEEPPTVRVEAERRGRQWVVSVHDEGIGIEPEDQDRIFTVFDRLHSREEYEGTGIGLALCERIVERHGGEIWVESEPGEGSTFSLTLSAP